MTKPGDHKHECKFCDYVWEHHDCNDVSHGDYGAHECPNCGRCNWGMGIYIGPLEAVSRNGREPVSNQVFAIHPDQLHPTKEKVSNE